MHGSMIQMCKIFLLLFKSKKRNLQLFLHIMVDFDYFLFCICSLSEFEDPRTVLVDEALVVGLQGLDVWDGGTLGVEIKFAKKKLS